MVVDDDQEICNNSFMHALSVRKTKSTKGSCGESEGRPQYHPHEAALFVDFSFHQLILKLLATTKGSIISLQALKSLWHKNIQIIIMRGFITGLLATLPRPDAKLLSKHQLLYAE